MCRRPRAWVAATIALILALMPVLALGDARTDRLVRLLRDSGNYRVRIQSAQSLGRIRDPETVPILVAALSDSHHAVRIASILALGRIGHPDAIAPLQRLVRDSGQPREVTRHAQEAISQIGRMSRPSTKSASSGAGSGRPRFYIGVGTMGNTTSRRPGELETKLQGIVRRQLSAQSSIDVAPDGETPRETKRVLAGRQLEGYFIQGSVTRLEETSGQIHAVVSIMVLTNPDRNLRMMLQGRGSVSGASGQLSESRRRRLEDSAVDGAVQGAIQRLSKQLASQR